MAKEPEFFIASSKAFGSFSRFWFDVVVAVFCTSAKVLPSGAETFIVTLPLATWLNVFRSEAESLSFCGSAALILARSARWCPASG